MMSIRKAVVIGFIVFLTTFFAQTGYQWWRWREGIKGAQEPSCDYNLKAIWLLSKRVSQLYRLPFPPPFEVVKAYTEKRPSILMTRQISEYLFGVGKLEGAYWTFDLILFCARDPDYLLKVAKVTQRLPYEPSYLWCSDSRTLAYCPYCGLAVLLDGKLERRGTTKP